MAVNLLGLDIGEKRIGLARLNWQVGLPEPLVTLDNDDFFTDKLQSIIVKYDIDTLVVGLPRNLNGQETQQTTYVRNFSQQKLAPLLLPIVWQDETLSSKAATDYIKLHKMRSNEIDHYAAAIILGDYFLTAQ